MGKLSTYQKLTAQVLSPEFFKEERMGEDEMSAYKAKYQAVFETVRLSNVSGLLACPIENGMAVNKASTGFPNLDNALGGGITEGSLVCLSGPPSVGKSTLSLQLAENMALNGRKVFYFSYEMSSEQIAAKSVSRRYFVLSGKKQGFPAMDILDRRKWEDKSMFGEKRFITDYKNAVQETEMANSNIYLFDCTTEPLSADDMETIVNNFIELYGQEPMVFVDYLHLIPAPKDGDGNELYTGEKAKLDYNMKKMRAMTSNLGCTIFLIAALRKDNYQSESSMESLLGSSGIPYSCDQILQLQYGAVNEKSFNLEAEQNLMPRRIELKISKSRYFGVGNKIKLDYYSKYDCFDDTADRRGWKSSIRDKGDKSK